MIYLLDSNVVIAILRGNPAPLVNKVQSHQRQDVAISSLVSHELYYGAWRSQHATRGIAGVDALPFEVVAFEYSDARESGKVRARLAESGQTIGLMDVLIAGQALARGLVLVTHNVREFGRVPGLRVEDWQE